MLNAFRGAGFTFRLYRLPRPDADVVEAGWQVPRRAIPDTGSTRPHPHRPDEELIMAEEGGDVSSQTNERLNLQALDGDQPLPINVGNG